MPVNSSLFFWEKGRLFFRRSLSTWFCILFDGKSLSWEKRMEGLFLYGQEGCLHIASKAIQESGPQNQKC